ncbi:uncharacterized protein LOC125495876 [Beta vulgaris subsp. vulgaris]|uniref:uncharacterized protein LOC125495876 n=2 Tax=Beta vulgaris subsp. vulgaris TaxID=3555 RepID=UPI0025494F55|nr:uncharacterized protein LOC125495876 [Beta vulgaris subsp. vulgaris]
MGLPTFGAFTQGNVPMQPVPTQPVPTQPRPQPELTEETPCELCNQGDGHGRFIIVAYGSVQPPRDRPLLHNQPVADIHYVVSVEDIVTGFEAFPLPLPNAGVGLQLLSDSIGSYILWPRALVRLAYQGSGKADRKGKKVASPQGGRRAQVGTNSSAKYPLITDMEVVQRLTKPCFWLHECISDAADEAMIEIKLSHHQFHYIDEETSTFISKDDIKEFLLGEELNVSMIQTFMRLLYNDVRRSSQPIFGWLCPSFVRDDSCVQNEKEVKVYLKDSLNACSRLGYKIVLLPYIESHHWTLIAICVSSNEVYHFDSLRKGTIRSLLVKSLLNSVMKKITSSGLRQGKAPVWYLVECPVQEGGLACGYYVMRFMLDIVNYCKDVVDLRKVCNF